MPGLLFDSWGAKDPNTASCCLTHKADTSHRQSPKIELMLSDAQQNPRETTLLSLSPCSHGLDLRLTAPNHEPRGGLSSRDRPRAKWQTVSPCPPSPAGRRRGIISSECENNNKTNSKSAFGYHRVLAKLNNVSNENVPPRKISFVSQVPSDCCRDCCISVKHGSFKGAPFITYPLTNKVSENPQLHTSGGLRTSTTQKFLE